jgi:hypothetical protein
MVVTVGFTTLLPPAAETGIEVLFWLFVIATELAFVTVTFSVTAPPLATVPGVAVIATVVAITATFAVAVVVPPAPFALSV